MHSRRAKTRGILMIGAGGLWGRGACAPTRPAAWPRRCRRPVELVVSWLIRSTGLAGRISRRRSDLVVKRKGLTADRLVAAGVAEGVARRAVGLGPLGK